MVAKFKQNKKRQLFKSVFFSILTGVLLILIIVFLALTNLKIKQRRDILISQLKAIEKEIQIQEEKNQELKSQASQSGTREYLEKVAREQLNMKAPDEEVVVVSKESSSQNPAGKTEEKNPWSPKTWWEWLKSKLRD